MKRRRILLIILVAIPLASLARHLYLRQVQWNAFEKLEAEVVADVTSDDFLHRTFELGSGYEANDIFLLEGFGPKAPLVYASIDTLTNFLEGIKPQTDRVFDVVVFLGLRSPENDSDKPRYFRYPVEVCGNKYCNFDESKLVVMPDDGKRPDWGVSYKKQSEIVNLDGFNFEVSHFLFFAKENRLNLLRSTISTSTVSSWDRLLAPLEQRFAPNYWTPYGVYSEYFVPGLIYRRGEYSK